MRLPQSKAASFPVCSPGVIFFLAVVLAIPLRAQGATQQLQSSPSSLNFGVVQVGQSQTQLIALTNTGQASVTISAISASDTEFTVLGVTLPAILGPGQSLYMSVEFSPTATGWLSGTITITSDASNSSLDIKVRGDGVAEDSITATPTRLRFGKVHIGQGASRSVVVTNTSSLNQTLAAFQTVGSGFTVNGPTLPYVLAAGQSTTLTISFAPQASGLVGGSVFITGPSLNVPFAGTGTVAGQLAISPATLDFGNVNIGSSGTQTSILTAVGGDVTVSSATSSDSQYVISGATFPINITAGQSANLSLVFSPGQAGTDAATLTVSSNASNSQATEALTGVGVSVHTVSLTWTASTSAVAGYNVYRKVAGGLYSQINTSLDPATSYTDAAVTSGVTYSYVATAVDSAGQESAFSTPVKVAIP